MSPTSFTTDFSSWCCITFLVGCRKASVHFFFLIERKGKKTASPVFLKWIYTFTVESLHPDTERESSLSNYDTGHCALVFWLGWPYHAIIQRMKRGAIHNYTGTTGWTETILGKLGCMVTLAEQISFVFYSPKPWNVGDFLCSESQKGETCPGSHSKCMTALSVWFQIPGSRLTSEMRTPDTLAT